MRGGGRSRASKRRRKERMEKRRAAANPSPVSSPSPARQAPTVRRVVVIDPGPFKPGRRVSNMPDVSRLSRKPASVPDAARKPVTAPDVAKPSRKRRASPKPLNSNVAAYRASQLDAKPGARAADAWRETAVQKAARDNPPDQNKLTECHPRPERKPKELKAPGSGSAPPPKFVNWCK